MLKVCWVEMTLTLLQEFNTDLIYDNDSLVMEKFDVSYIPLSDETLTKNSEMFSMTGFVLEFLIATSANMFYIAVLIRNMLTRNMMIEILFFSVIFFTVRILTMESPIFVVNQNMLLQNIFKSVRFFTI